MRHEMKAGSLPELTFHLDFASHHVHQPLADGEPETGAAVFARRGVVCLRKFLKQPGPLLLGHADASVSHGKAQNLGFAASNYGDREPHVSALSELNGIGKQVG